MKLYEIKYRMQNGKPNVDVRHAQDIKKALDLVTKKIQLHQIISVGEREKDE